MRQVEKELEKTVLDFLLPLRMGKGLDADKYSAMCDVLGSLKARLSDEDSIPKSWAVWLVDTVPHMEGCAYLYPEHEAEKIFDKAQETLELIYDVLT